MSKKIKGKMSKGERNSISRKTISLTKIENRKNNPCYREDNVLDAWLSGKDPWVKINNTDPNTNKKEKYSWVKANEYWGIAKKIKNYTLPIKKEQ